MEEKNFRGGMRGGKTRGGGDGSLACVVLGVEE